MSSKAYFRAWQARRKAQGLCVSCGRTRDRDGVVCEPCRLQMKLRNHVRYHAARAAGLCFRCGKPAQNGRARCPDCLAKTNDQRKARRARLLSAQPVGEGSGG